MQRWRSQTLLLPIMFALSSATQSVCAQIENDLFDIPLEQLEEIVVMARKRAGAEEIQSVPVAITAFNHDQLKALGFNSLLDISYSIPNVSLDEIGTSRGVASFSIRGLSATSSIVSFDPAVATFVDGIYLPQNAGTVLDMFDVDTVEVLRGPQGTLFGRNVTGGAVLIRNKRPGQENSSEAILRYESGAEEPTYTIGGAIQGGLTSTLSARLSAYYSEDKGYFENYALRADPTLNVDDVVGANDIWFVRPSILWEPTETFEVWLKYEHMKQEGQQLPAQNQANFFGKEDDRVSLNYIGEGSYEIDSVTVELNWDIGSGTLTDLAGWRSMDAEAGTDVDGTRFSRFHTGGFLESRAYSNELRYSGSAFDKRLDFTIGSFLYKATTDNVTQQNIFDFAIFNEGGGNQDTESYAFFTESEYRLTDKWSMLFGLRYSNEKKEVDFIEIAGANCEGPTSFPLDHLPRCTISSSDSDEWQTLGGKFGGTYTLSEDILFYAHFTRGFRSGGFNVRDAVADGTNPPSYDEEKIDVVEIGMKADWADGRVRSNVAVFHNWAKDLQRDVNVPAPTGTGAIQQSTANTADANILGVEFEGSWLPRNDLTLKASFGWLDFDYKDVRFDLDGDGIVTSADKDQEFPRVAKWTYSASITHRQTLSIGAFTAQIAYDHRDDVFFTDNNLTPIHGPDLLRVRASLGLLDGKFEIAVFGKNLLNHTVASGSSAVASSISAPDPAFPTTSLFTKIGSGTFSPIQKGRVIGLEINASF